MKRHSRLLVTPLFGLAVLMFIPSPAAVAQGGPPSADTAHFLCYQATDSHPNAPITISLDDQFCPAATEFCLENVTAMTALEFCNPTSKIRNGVTTPIVEGDLHLTFYELTQKLSSARKRVAVTNQFGRQILRVAAPPDGRGADFEERGRRPE